jgi:hypothetical protein
MLAKQARSEIAARRTVKSAMMIANVDSAVLERSVPKQSRRSAREYLNLLSRLRN